MVIEKIGEWEKRFKETSVNCIVGWVDYVLVSTTNLSVQGGGKTCESTQSRDTVLKLLNLLNTNGGRQRQKQSILRERSKRQRDRQMEKETPTRRYREKDR